METIQGVPEIENPEVGLERLLENLREYGEWFNELPEAVQDEWNMVEMEVESGLDREAARIKLEEFLKKLGMEVEVIKSASQL